MQISDVCEQSRPCKHSITYPDGTQGGSDGQTIAEWYQSAGLEVPKHFREYIKKPKTLPARVDMSRCIESDPCEHMVTYPDGSQSSKDGETIAGWYQSAGLDVPKHFREYLKPNDIANTATKPKVCRKLF